MSPNSVLKFRFYFIVEERILRVGLDSSNKGVFTKLAGKKVYLVELRYFLRNTGTTRFDAISINYVDIYDNGNWEFTHYEQIGRKVAEQMDLLLGSGTKKISHLVPKPKLNNKEREALKGRIIKDYDIYFWNNVKNYI